MGLRPKTPATRNLPQLDRQAPTPTAPRSNNTTPTSPTSDEAGPAKDVVRAKSDPSSQRRHQLGMRPAAADASAPPAGHDNPTADLEHRGPLDGFISQLQELFDARVDEAAWRRFNEVLHELMEEVERICQLKSPPENTAGAERRR